MAKSPGASPTTANAPRCVKRMHTGQTAYSKAEEAACRRNVAASWIKSMVESVEMPSEPSPEEFCSWLKSGLILCKLINKIIPGAISKVVDNGVSSVIPQGQPLSAYQYFQNVRNFLVAVDELKLPTFESSDLEQGSIQPSSMAKIVDCILALKHYHEWKLSRSNGPWKYAGPLRSPMVPRNPANLQHSSSAKDIDMQSLSVIMNKSNCDPLNLSADANSTARETAKTDESNTSFHRLQKDSEDYKVHVPETVGSLLDHRKVDIMNHKENIDQNLPLCQRTADMKYPTQALVSPKFSADRTADKSLQEEIKGLTVPPGEKQLENYKESQIGTEEQEKHVTGTIQKRTSDALSEGQHPKCSEISQKYLIKMAEQKEQATAIKTLIEKTKEDMHAYILEKRRNLEVLDNKVAEMAKAAEGYQRVLEENKRLYNELQDLKGAIRVFCRVRPLFGCQSNAPSAISFVGDDGSLLVSAPNTGKDADKLFNFNKVFGPSATQEEVYKETQALIRCVMDGYNVCIFAYGQTGSGKTYTMSGPESPSEKELGVNYRALADLFEISRKRAEVMSYEVSVQMIEIYNEQVRDLLCKESGTKKLEIRSSAFNNGFNVPDATLIPVNSPTTVLDLMTLGQGNRAVSSTALNDRSSRSHSVLIVHVEGKNNVSGATLHSCLNLIDLAGSERVDKSEVTGDRLKEAQHINKSLSALGDVISALAQKHAHIPYRNSKLTLLLQDSLGGQAKTLMFAHISPEPDSYGETISTLKFAERVATVELGSARSNKESGEVRDLKEQVESLKRIVAKKDEEIARKDADLAQLRREGSPVLKYSRPRRTSLEGPGIGRTVMASPMSSSNAINAEDGLRASSIFQTNSRRSSIGYGTSRHPKTPESKRISNNTRLSNVINAEDASRASSIVQTNSRRSSIGYGTCRHPKTPESKRISNNTVSDAYSAKSTANSAMKSTSTVSKIKRSMNVFGKNNNAGEKRTKQADESPARRTLFEGGDRRLSVARNARRQSIAVVPHSSPSSERRRASLAGKINVDRGRSAVAGNSDKGLFRKWH